jgi:dTDP-4-dehydrorhamnose reductase
MSSAPPGVLVADVQAPTNPAIGSVLIIGAGGMLARAWEELLKARGIKYAAWSIDQFNLCEPAHVARLSAEWEVVVNCAAYTQVDLAEQHEDDANKVNGDAVGALARRIAELGTRLVHYSTDYVFDGKATQPYPVDAPIAPQSVYGSSKALGERLVRESGAAALIIRTSWLYAPWGNNFVRTIGGLLRTKPELKVVHDQRGRPTSAVQLAERSWGLCERGQVGTFHITDAGECSWYEFAVEIGVALGLQTPVHPVTTAEFPRPAPRPAYSVLDGSKADAVLGPALPWQRALRDALARME